MSTQKVVHSVIKPNINTSIAGGATSDATEWFDVNGWTDKVFSYDIDQASGSVSVTFVAHVSPQGYYELNNKTATTEDYQSITLAASASATTLTRVDAGDLDDLQRPWRSARFAATNNSASNATVVSTQIEGWL